MMKLADLCKERNISVERLAAEAETSASNIRSLLAGNSIPRVDLAKRIAQYLGVHVEDIDWGAKPSPADDSKNDPAVAA